MLRGRHTRCRPYVLTAPLGAVKTRVRSLRKPMFAESWQSFRASGSKAYFRIRARLGWSVYFESLACGVRREAALVG